MEIVGVSAERAAQALAQCRWDVDAAINLLVDGGPRGAAAAAPPSGGGGGGDGGGRGVGGRGPGAEGAADGAMRPSAVVVGGAVARATASSTTATAPQGGHGSSNGRPGGPTSSSPLDASDSDSEGDLVLVGDSGSSDLARSPHGDSDRNDRDVSSSSSSSSSSSGSGDSNKKERPPLLAAVFCGPRADVLLQPFEPGTSLRGGWVNLSNTAAYTPARSHVHSHTSRWVGCVFANLHRHASAFFLTFSSSFLAFSHFVGVGVGVAGLRVLRVPQPPPELAR
jgi:hypothetical protein